MFNCHPDAKKRKRRKETKHIPGAKRREKKTYLERIEILLRDDQETCFVGGCPSEQDPPD